MGNDIKERLQGVLSHLPQDVSLVAVSKYHPTDQLMAAYEAGQRLFGESHVQELRQKQPLLPADVEWHFIGHLQTNKVKYIAPYIGMVDAVDSMRLLAEIHRQAARCNRVIDVLLELHVAQEATKYGLTLDDCRRLLDDGQWRELDHVRICGLMMMASNTDDQEQISREFDLAHSFFDEVKRKHFAQSDYFRVRSWGMSHDYRIAVAHGANMVRVGTSIFGERQY